MTKLVTPFALAICAAALFVGGCAKNERVLHVGVDRNPVVFESHGAENAFEEELEERYDDGDADIAAMRGRLSRNAFFNSQINVADHNGDGIISDHEAHEYAH